MKTLQESLLDNDDVLFNNTSFEKGFPKESSFKTYKQNDLNFFYYRFKNDLIADVFLSKINSKFKVIYVKWCKVDKDCIIRIFLSKESLNQASLLLSFIDRSTHNLNDAQKLSYELLTNIKNNPQIINFIFDDEEYYKDIFKHIDVERIKNKFKDTWVDIK